MKIVPSRCFLYVCYNLQTSNNICHILTLKGCTSYNQAVSTYFRRLYCTDKERSKQAEFQEKRKKFQELEGRYQKFLEIDKLNEEEKRIHFLHAAAVEKGHFTYDDPFLNEKVLTRLRHFLKGKCCGKSCRHCIYEHSAVVDEKKKAQARFNSSFWVYDGEEEVIEFDEQHVVTYGRGPYPRKYAQNAPPNMIKLSSKPK